MYGVHTDDSFSLLYVMSTLHPTIEYYTAILMMCSRPTLYKDKDRAHL